MNDVFDGSTTPPSHGLPAYKVVQEVQAIYLQFTPDVLSLKPLNLLSLLHIDRLPRTLPAVADFEMNIR